MKLGPAYQCCVLSDGGLRSTCSRRVMDILEYRTVKTVLFFPCKHTNISFLKLQYKLTESGSISDKV